MMTYRGRPVAYAVHDQKADTYTLVSADGGCMAELPARAFLSLPNRTNLEVRSGRYRSAGSKDKRSANRKSREAGRDAADNIAFAHYQSGRRAGKNAGAGLTAQQDAHDIARMYAQARRDMMNLMSAWNTPPTLWQSIALLEPTPKPPLKREGIIAGEIVGYRCWRIEDGWLRSVYQSDVWKPGCVLEGRELGDWDSRGIHAWKDAGSRAYSEYVRSYLNSSDNGLLNHFRGGRARPAMVTGTVFLWGDVVEHQRGWRAEFARVRSLDWLYPDETMMGREQHTLDDLRSLYGLTAPCSLPAHRPVDHPQGRS